MNSTHHHSHPASGEAGELHEHDLGLQHDLGTLERRGLSRGMGRRGVLGVLGGLWVVAVAGAPGTTPPSASTSTTPSSPPSGGPGGGPGGAMGGDSSVEVAEGEIPEETAGPYPGRRVQRAQRAHRERRGAQRHHDELRDRRPAPPRRAAHAALQGLRPHRRRCRGAGRGGDVRLALRPRRRLLDVLRRRGRRELPARRPGVRCRRVGGVHHGLPRLLLRPLAARALRGLRVAGRRDECLQQAAHLAAGLPAGRLRGRSTPRRATSRRWPTWPTSLDSDGIFSDGYSLQMATTKGSVTDGYTATLNVPIDAASCAGARVIGYSRAPRAARR